MPALHCILPGLCSSTKIALATFKKNSLLPLPGLFAARSGTRLGHQQTARAAFRNNRHFCAFESVWNDFKRRAKTFSGVCGRNNCPHFALLDRACFAGGPWLA
eukprot:6177704-Pleurochrysis_carterae.AAC.4